MNNDHRYGIPAGFNDERQPRTPVSPVSASASVSSLAQYGQAQYGHPVAANQIRAPHRTVSPLVERHSMPPPPPPQHTYIPSALRDIDNLYGERRSLSPSPEPEKRVPYTAPRMPATPPRQSGRAAHQHTDSASSVVPLMRYQDSPTRQSPSPTRRGPGANVALGTVAMDSYGHEVPNRWRDDGYGEAIDPETIADNGYDGLDSPPPKQRGIRGGLGAGAAAGAGAFKVLDVRHGSEAYDRVPGNARSSRTADPEKSEWLDKQSNGSKRLRWIIGSVLAVLIVAAIVGGAVGGVLASKKSGSGTSASSPSSHGSNGLYDINSSEVKALLNNKALHKVFPGMDYTPLDAQYPACLTNPPDQNNITLDIATLAQLTPAVRLYGTDCNQTEMVLTAIDRLGYNSTLQVWLGVWLGNNETTNARQLDSMYTILQAYPSSHFAGIIVGNEVLFRKDLPITTLAQTLADVRKNLTDLSITLPVATSDLGNDWTAELALDSDIVMANVHPFFAGVTPDVAPGWTYNFWQDHNAMLTTAAGATKAAWPNSIISEVGWPSEGGNDCGTQDGSCPSETAGAVASVENMNTFMDGFVCQSLANGTTFFWFEAFDEPWKHQFDTDTDKWESKWGLMDENRKVKDGLKIPDCGGTTVDKAY